MPTNIAIGTQENNHMLSVCIITKNEEHNLAQLPEIIPEHRI